MKSGPQRLDDFIEALFWFFLACWWLSVWEVRLPSA